MPMPPKPKAGSKKAPGGKKTTTASSSSSSRKPAAKSTNASKPTTAASSKKASRASSSTAPLSRNKSQVLEDTANSGTHSQQLTANNSSPSSKVQTPRGDHPAVGAAAVPANNQYHHEQNTAAVITEKKEKIVRKKLTSAPCDLLRIPKALKYKQVREYIESNNDEIVHFSAEIDELFLDDGNKSGAKIPRIVAITDQAVYKFPFSVVLNDDDVAAEEAALKEQEAEEKKRNNNASGRSYSPASSSTLGNASFFSFEERRFPLKHLLELVAIDSDKSLQGHTIGGLDVQVFSKNPENGSTVLSFTLNFGELTARRQAFLLNLSMIKPEINIMEKKKIKRISAMHDSPFGASSAQQQKLLQEEADEERARQANAGTKSYLTQPNVREIGGGRPNNNNSQHHQHRDPYNGSSYPGSTTRSTSRSPTNNTNASSSNRPPFGSTFMKPTATSIQRKTQKSSSPPSSSTTEQLRKMRNQDKRDCYEEPLPPHLDPKNYDYEREKMLEEEEYRALNNNNNNDEAENISAVDRSESTQSQGGGSTTKISAAQQYEFDQQKQQIHNLLMATTDVNSVDDENYNNASPSMMITSPNPRNPLVRRQQQEQQRLLSASTPRNILRESNTHHDINNNNCDEGIVMTPELRRRINASTFSTPSAFRNNSNNTSEQQQATIVSPRTGSIYNNYKYNDDPERWHERDEIRAMLITREEQIATDANFREMSPGFSSGRRRYTQFAKGVQIDFPKANRSKYTPQDLSDAELLGPSLYPQWRHWKMTGGLLQVLKERKARMLEKAERDRQMGVYHATNSGNNLMSMINGNLSSARSQSIAAASMLQAKARSRGSSVYNPQEREEFDLCEEDDRYEDEDAFDFCDESWTLFDSDDMIRSLKQIENELVGRVGKKSLDRLQEMRKLVERERRMFANSALVRAMEGKDPDGGSITSRTSQRDEPVLSSALARSFIPDTARGSTTSRSGAGAQSTSRSRGATTANSTTPEPFKLSLSPNLERYVRRHDIPERHQIDVEAAINEMKDTLSARNRTMQELQREEYLREIGKEFAHGNITSPRALISTARSDGDGGGVSDRIRSPRR